MHTFLLWTFFILYNECNKIPGITSPYRKKLNKCMKTFQIEGVSEGDVSPQELENLEIFETQITRFYAYFG